MITGVIDTTVVLYLYRKRQDALAWLAHKPSGLVVTPITWLEVMYGAPGKVGQANGKAILDLFPLEYLTSQDFDWAMAQMEQFRLSKGVSTNDCLIASVANRLHVPVLTHNVKDMRVMLPPDLVNIPF